ncbi:MAG: head decoration protein [Wenzhouxiangella sp.]
MTTLTEGRHAGEYLVSEPNGHQGRESVIVVTGQNLVAGAVVGRISKVQAAASNPAVVGTGNGTMTLVRGNKAVKTGNYVVTCITAVTNGGVFSVVDPDGVALPGLTLTVASGGSTAYVSDQIQFTITDGGTDFAVADKFTIAVTAAGVPAIVGTGDGLMSAVSLGKYAENGTYQALCTATDTNAGTFSVIAPNGEIIGTAKTITGGAGGTLAFASDHVNFTLTDGSTDFAVGDYFNILVTVGSQKITAWVPTATNGAQVATGILFDNVDATSDDKAGVISARDTEVNGAELTYFTGASAGEKALAAKQLAAHGIIVR